jgi:NAD(P)-dependent dehydrogenase (short-subunit alcohol dehydrogenase family)
MGDEFADTGSSVDDRFRGRVALVTGGSRGIGLAVVRRLVAGGARVCLTARGSQNLDDVVESLPPGTAIAVAGKVDDPVHRDETFDRIQDAFGRLDFIVNNTAINPVLGDLSDLDLEVARRMLDVNVLAPLAWIQNSVRRADLGFAAGGAVVNLSSVAGATPSPGIGWYGVTKAALEHATRTLAVELGPQIRVNAVAPALVRTRFSEALYLGKEDEVSRGYPLRRIGIPDDVAAAVGYLLSDDAAWVTGQVLTLDGGLLNAGGRA